MCANKKLNLIIAFTAMLCVTLFSVLPAYAAIYSRVKYYKDGNYTYTLDDGYAQITKTDKKLEGEVTVPQTLGGYKVNKICKTAFADCRKITKLTIEDNILYIEDYAFSGCKALKEITFPNYLESMGGYICANCTLLETVNYNCIDAKPLYMTDKKIAPPFYNLKIKQINFGKDVAKIPSGLFYDAKGTFKITDIDFPSRLTEIGSYAFYGCEYLKYVDLDLPKIKSVGDYAFCGCDSVRYVYLPQRSKSVSFGENAFESDVKFY